MSETRILIADDSEESRVGLVRLLRTVDVSYDVRLAESGRDALRAVTDHRPQVLIAAVFLRPGPSGTDLCARIRRAPALRHIGVALLAPDLRSKARALALSDGADLVLVPREVQRELPLRLRGLVDCAYERKGDRLRCGEILLCPESRRAWVGGRALNLSPALLRALHGLLLHPERIQTYHELTGSDPDADPGAEPGRARVVVCRLRRELGKKHGLLIEPVRGIGYRLHLERDEV